MTKLLAMACQPFHLITLFTALFTLPFFIVAKNIGVMTVGAQLSTSTGNTSLVSSSGDFTFGFHQLDANTFLPAVWYTKIPETIVWWAADQDGDHANTGPKGSKILLTADEGLVLKDPQGNTPWRTPLSGVLVHDCLVNDTGNLVIRSADGKTLWQSFDYPRDTMLPSQTMAAGGQTIFYSKLSETNFTRGKFQLSLLSDGNLVLNTRSLDPLRAVDTIYNYHYIGPDSSNRGINFSYNSSRNMYILLSDRTEINLLDGVTVPTPENDYYFRATLNFDGVLVWYSHQKNSSSPDSGWSVITYQPSNICADLTGGKDSGVCGYNAICTLGGGDYPRPNCSCPPGYSFPDQADRFSTCKPNFEMGCGENNGYYMVPLYNTDWPTNDYAYSNSVTAEQCKNSCLADCLCTASIYRDNGCWKKRYPLSNGHMNSSVTQATAFLKVNNLSNPSVGTEDKRVIKALVSSLATLVFVNLVAVFCGIRFIYCRQYKRISGVKKAHMEYNNVKCFTYKELEEATEGFKQELGSGACAVVYKGIVGKYSDGSEAHVAVKKIDRAFLKEAEQEFQTEINVIGQTHHRNLVRLIGYCNEEEHHLLVYEFMSNGCLADFLFREEKPSWVDRINIAIGIAKGLLYLHEECNTQIIHCDIKPQNILLDDHFDARISDFGLSKLLMLNQFQTVTAIRGTKGYVAPEWFRNKPVTAKVDVYSFGVLLLEIISCRRSILRDVMEDDQRAVLADWAFSCYISGSLENLVIDDVVALGDRERLVRFVKVGIWCTQEDPNLRPTMRQVNQMLEGVVEVPSPPCSYPQSFSQSNAANYPYPQSFSQSNDANYLI